MSHAPVLFNCYYNGKFNNSDNQVTYDGGNMKTIGCDPRKVFNDLVAVLGIPLYNQRIWYKLPFENFGELKIMCNGDESFQRMCEAFVFTKLVDIFLEKDDDAVNCSGDASHGNDTTGGNGNDTIGGNGDEMCEEARIEKTITGFVDEEEEQCNDEDTPPNSDCEEGEEAEGKKRQYDRYTKYSGEIRLEQTFDSICEFKEAVVDYVLKTGWNM